MEGVVHQNDLKCYNCGKGFKKQSDFDRHKNRKTPCLIREVAPEHINNPNRCIFCNKIFSKKEHVTRHLKTCKIKNGGMDLLIDKVKYEQELRILKEQLAFKEKENAEQIQQLREEVAVLKNIVATNLLSASTQTVNNFNTLVQITINNYTSPTIEGLIITPAELTNVNKLTKFLLQKLYFNPSLPLNHCIYLQNKKDKTLVIYDNGQWRTVTGENIEEVIIKLGNTMYTTGVELINGPSGPYKGSEAEFTQLPGGVKQKIIEFNRKGQLSSDDAYEVFLSGREVVYDTIKASGCKLI